MLEVGFNGADADVEITRNFGVALALRGELGNFHLAGREGIPLPSAAVRIGVEEVSSMICTLNDLTLSSTWFGDDNCWRTTAENGIRAET